MIRGVAKNFPGLGGAKIFFESAIYQRPQLNPSPYFYCILSLKPARMAFILLLLLLLTVWKLYSLVEFSEILHFIICWPNALSACMDIQSINQSSKSINQSSRLNIAPLYTIATEALYSCSKVDTYSYIFLTSPIIITCSWS